MADTTKPTRATARQASTEATPTTTTPDSGIVVADKAVDLPENTEAAAKEAQTSEAGDELREVNPATTPGDNLPVNATLTENPAGLPGPGTGYHCGICGQPVSSTGEHYDGDGDVVAAPHANAMVLADEWPIQRAAGDAEAIANKAEAKAKARETNNTETLNSGDANQAPASTQATPSK